MKITLKTVLLKSVKILSIKPCTSRESKKSSSQFSYTVIVVTQTWSF